MSSNSSFLALRLEGPLQSWGFDSQYNRRNTGLMPTKSAIAGMCCAALGYARGSWQEKEFLEKFANVRMTAISIPISPRDGKRELPVRRFQDYHTVQGTMRAKGTPNENCVETHRQYLSDAAFGIVLEGDSNLLSQIAYGGPESAPRYGLADPKWGVWLGRKSCIPTSPVLAGLFDKRDEAVKSLIADNSIDSYTRQIEAANFTDGRDSLPDVPISFDSGKRMFSPRRVRTLHAGEIE